MDWQLNGLPLHVLILHVVVVAVPIAALLVILTAAWPAARRRLGIMTPIIAFAALISVALTIEAGQWLEEQVAETALSEAHVEMGEIMVPWVIGLTFVSVLQWAWYRYFTTPGARYANVVTTKNAQLAVTIALAVIIAVTSVGSVVTVVIVGESGAQAVWNGKLGTGD